MKYELGFRTTSTNTVFKAAKTRGMVVPVARLSIDHISVQNQQVETHTLQIGIEDGVIEDMLSHGVNKDILPEALE